MTALSPMRLEDMLDALMLIALATAVIFAWLWLTT
jgi:hypothetical protein